MESYERTKWDVPHTKKFIKMIADKRSALPPPSAYQWQFCPYIKSGPEWTAAMTIALILTNVLSFLTDLNKLFFLTLLPSMSINVYRYNSMAADIIRLITSGLWVFEI